MEQKASFNFGYYSHYCCRRTSNTTWGLNLGSYNTATALDLLQQMSTVLHSACCYIHLAEMWLNQEVISLPFHGRLIFVYLWYTNDFRLEWYTFHKSLHIMKTIINNSFHLAQSCLLIRLSHWGFNHWEQHEYFKATSLCCLTLLTNSGTDHWSRQWNIWHWTNWNFTDISVWWGAASKPQK